MHSSQLRNGASPRNEESVIKINSRKRGCFCPWCYFPWVIYVGRGFVYTGTRQRCSQGKRSAICIGRVPEMKNSTLCTSRSGSVQYPSGIDAVISLCVWNGAQHKKKATTIATTTTSVHKFQHHHLRHYRCCLFVLRQCRLNSKTTIKNKCTQVKLNKAVHRSTCAATAFIHNRLEQRNAGRNIWTAEHFIAAHHPNWPILSHKWAKDNARSTATEIRTAKWRKNAIYDRCETARQSSLLEIRLAFST